MTLEPGTQVSANIRLVSQLAEGGMASIWVGEHLNLDTQVAVKFVDQELAEKNPLVLQRFKREATLAAMIKSPHVVQTLDHGVMADGTPFIVMELLEGYSLEEYIVANGKLSPRKMGLILSQTAKVLHKAHVIGIVHRDIKPDNLFLVDSHYDVFVKVLDFGIAKDTLAFGDSMTRTGAMIGTPAYMSPEQIESSKDADFRSDLWSLGVVMYHGLMGAPPFGGETVGAICVAISAASFAPPSRVRPELPPALDDWFQCALSRNPDERFGSAQEMAASYAHILAAAQGSEHAGALHDILLRSRLDASVIPPPSTDAPSSKFEAVEQTVAIGDSIFGDDEEAEEMWDDITKAVSSTNFKSLPDSHVNPPKRMLATMELDPEQWQPRAAAQPQAIQQPPSAQQAAPHPASARLQQPVSAPPPWQMASPQPSVNPAVLVAILVVILMATVGVLLVGFGVIAIPGL